MGPHQIFWCCRPECLPLGAWILSTAGKLNCDVAGAYPRALSGSLEVQTGVFPAGTLDPQDCPQGTWRGLQEHIRLFQDFRGCRDKFLLSGPCASRTIHRLWLKQAGALSALQSHSVWQAFLQLLDRG